MLIKVSERGSLTCVHHAGELDQFRLGRNSTLRASHVEPVNPVLRLLFHCIRQRCEEDSTWAARTRRWRCRWRVNVIDGPTFGNFRDRDAAIAAEVQWLRENVLC